MRTIFPLPSNSTHLQHTASSTEWPCGPWPLLGTHPPALEMSVTVGVSGTEPQGWKCVATKPRFPLAGNDGADWSPGSCVGQVITPAVHLVSASGQGCPQRGVSLSPALILLICTMALALWIKGRKQCRDRLLNACSQRTYHVQGPEGHLGTPAWVAKLPFSLELSFQCLGRRQMGHWRVKKRITGDKCCREISR